MKPTDALHIPATEPRREGLTTAQRWHGPDSGLIACWERGRDKAWKIPVWHNVREAANYLSFPGVVAATKH